jgi:hypothetical protein
MDMISNFVSWILAFFASVLGNIIAHDICVSADRTCKKIISNAAGRLAPFDRESGELEWLAHLHDCETVREKYKHAIGCFLVAGKMRSKAQTVLVVLNFQIAGIGTVPLTLNINSRFVGPTLFKLFGVKFIAIKYAVVTVAVVYLVLKFARSAKSHLTPGLKITKDHLAQYKSWRYEAHVKGKRVDLNLSNIFRVMVHHPQRIPEIIEKMSKILVTNSSNGA